MIKNIARVFLCCGFVVLCWTAYAGYDASKCPGTTTKILSIKYLGTGYGGQTECKSLLQTMYGTNWNSADDRSFEVSSECDKYVNKLPYESAWGGYNCYDGSGSGHGAGCYTYTSNQCACAELCKCIEENPCDAALVALIRNATCANKKYTCNHCKVDGTGCTEETDAAYVTNKQDLSDKWTWDCVGKVGGTGEVDCEYLKPVNGVCDNTTKYTCTEGTLNSLSDALDPNDNKMYHKWECIGINGGTDATDCKIQIPPTDGICDTTQNNGCTQGSFQDKVDTSSEYKWECLGVNGGNDDDCSMVIPPVDGVCDNTQNNGCTKGTLNDIADTSTQYKWNCLGAYGGAHDNCGMTIPVVNGQCDNTTKNACTVGTFSDVADTNTLYKWKCLGAHNGTSDNCDLAIPVINGQCDNTTKNACTKGSFEDLADTNTLYKWKCKGVHGGTDANNCQKTITPINGQCSTAFNHCVYGSLNDIADTSTHWKWECKGLHGGTDDNNCNKKIPAHGSAACQVYPPTWTEAYENFSIPAGHTVGNPNDDKGPYTKAKEFRVYAYPAQFAESDHLCLNESGDIYVGDCR